MQYMHSVGEAGTLSLFSSGNLNPFTYGLPHFFRFIIKRGKLEDTVSAVFALQGRGLQNLFCTGLRKLPRLTPSDHTQPNPTLFHSYFGSPLIGSVF